MKTNLFPIATFASAIAALILLPVSPEAAGVLVAVPGIVSLFILEYSRPAMRLAPCAEIRPFDPSARTLVDGRKAA
jgi:hypothetical protein